MCIRNMNNMKAAWPDGIVAEHIRIAEPVIINYLILLYIYDCIRTIIIEKNPVQFKKGLVISLFKGRTHDSFNTHKCRYKTFTSVLPKLFQKVLYIGLSANSST